jgi:DNA-binding XRE family transcriptional regulator
MAQTNEQRMTKEDLADRVHTLRDGFGETQREFAERTGYAPSTICNAENYRGESDGMTGVRITIIEKLTGKKIEGPFWRDAE